MAANDKPKSQQLLTYVTTLQPCDGPRLWKIGKIQRLFGNANDLSIALSGLWFGMKVGRMPDTRPYQYTLPDYPGCVMHVAVPAIKKEKKKPKRSIGSDTVLPPPQHLASSAKNNAVVIEIGGKRVTIEDA